MRKRRRFLVGCFGSGFVRVGVAIIFASTGHEFLGGHQFLMAKAKAGDWVQIHNVILPAEERAPQVPEDTRQVPFEVWLKGFLVDDESEVGQEVTIVTVTGRQIEGTLVAIKPVYPHNFGEPVPELLGIGHELREFLAEEHE